MARGNIMGLSWIADDIDPASVPGSMPHPKREPGHHRGPSSGGTAAHPHRARKAQSTVLAVAARLAALASSHLIAGYLSGAPARRGSFRRYWV
jgi:hypothetical protein